MNRQQRRQQLKDRRKANKPHRQVEDVQAEPWVWSGLRDTAKVIEPQPVPGVNIPPEFPEFTEQVNRNKWHDREEIDSFVNTIKELSLDTDDNEWSWAYNHTSKYINLRFDMRDGGFIMTNDEGVRINLDQLRWQRK